MGHASPDSEPSTQVLEEILAAYLRAVETGKRPDRQELLERHPDLADELRAFFDNLDHFDKAAGAPITPHHADETALALPCAFGEYELLEKIAHGGMGVVWKARHRRLNRLVALKTIRAGEFASPDERRRFQLEAQNAALLEHPHIVPLYEVGEYQGQHYFSMKLIEGGSLAQQLPRLAQDYGGIARLLATVARAVHYAHERGILHRDLKPANILLERRAGDVNPLVPHVADFGLAKRLEGSAELSQSGAVVGTPSYMAPEQAAGRRPLTTAADVYSLGAILHELLTGRPPFRGETHLATLVLVQEREPPRPRALRPGIPADLETVCLKCLRKEPAERYASAAALADDLQRYLAGEPIRARPVGWVEWAVKWARRHPAQAAAYALVVLVLVLGGVGGSMALLWQEAEAARQEAVGAREQLAVALDPDGKRLASASGDRTVKVWDMATGQEVITLKGHTESVESLAFSPDGKRLASASGDRTVKVWDVATGQECLPLKGHHDSVWSVAFSPGGKRLASTSGDGTVKVWGATSGLEVLGPKAAKAH